MLLPTLIVSATIACGSMVLLVLSLCAAAAQGDRQMPAEDGDAWYLMGTAPLTYPAKRDTGIEPVSPAWEAGVLPMN